MAVEELKKQLHSYIDLIDDEDSLLMLNDAVAAYATEQIDILDLLTPEQLERLELGRQQAREGKTKTHEEVMQMSQEWLKKGLK